MRIIPDQLRSKNLVPFRKRHGRYNIPGMTSENQILMDRVDPDLSPEEQSYVRHYLGYADALMRSVEENPLTERSELVGGVLSSEDQLREQQPPADQPPTNPLIESGPATEDHPVRAA